MKPRMLCWFSCGGPSAVAAKKSIELCSETHEVVVVNCDTRASEHEDNYRFSRECEAWFGQSIVYLKNPKYVTVDQVFEETKYMSGVGGARCTTELKKRPRLEYARVDDVHVFGFTAEEEGRMDAFRNRNPDLILRFILSELWIFRLTVIKILDKAGIKLPEMYLKGYDNNNCPGCVKASSPWYWDKIRTDFPEVFKRRCEQSRKIGCRLVEIHHHERIFLDELPPGPFKRYKKENMSCGPECGQLSLL